MLLTGAALALIAGAAVAAPPEHKPPGQRYPYDPVCRWGRIADGHGMLLRCLTEGEATMLTKNDAPRPAAKPPRAKPTPTPESEPEQQPAEPALTAQVTSVQVDSGELPLAQRKLNQPIERYVRCVLDHGGLSAGKGAAHLRFLVRERGRAEGVSIKEAKGMTQSAAKCIADVVDRRFVGYPAAPMVGTTVVVEVTPTK